MQRRQRGFMAIVLVVFLVVFTIMAASIVSMTTSGARGAGDHVNASAALFMAESGIEWAARALFDADDPQSDCQALLGQGSVVNDGGSFSIVDAEYQTGTESCRITSRGLVNPASRTLVGIIPKRILDGDSGGGDDMFDDSGEKFGNSCNPPNVTCEDGALIFHRPGQGGGNPPTDADGDALVSDTFEVGDNVYFTANIEWDGDPSGNLFTVELRNNIAACSVSLPALSSGCGVTGHDLNDQFDIVLLLGDDFSAEDINTVRLLVNWAQNSSNNITLTNGCIGREGHCSGEGSDDPIDDGGWDEDP